jgi:arabinogalactan endo-1,4-beta-galactosidase
MLSRQGIAKRGLLEASIISESDKVETYARSFLRATDLSSLQAVYDSGAEYIVLPSDFTPSGFPKYSNNYKMAYWQIYDEVNERMPPPEVMLKKMGQEISWISSCYVNDYLKAFRDFSQASDFVISLPDPELIPIITRVKSIDDKIVSIEGEKLYFLKATEIEDKEINTVRGFTPYSNVSAKFKKIIEITWEVISNDKFGACVVGHTQDSAQKCLNDTADNYKTANPEINFSFKILPGEFQVSGSQARAFINVSIFDISNNYTLYSFPNNFVKIGFIGVNFLAKAGDFEDRSDEVNAQSLFAVQPSCPSGLGIISPNNNICNFFKVSPTTSCQKTKPLEVYNTFSSKPALQEFRSNPGIMLGVDADMAYDLSRDGYTWKDAATGVTNTNVNKLFRNKGVDWSRIMLFWNETETGGGGFGEYYNSLDYVNNSLVLAKNAGLKVAVVLSLIDGWNRRGGFVNLSQITIPSRYNASAAKFYKFDELDENERLSIIEEYAENVDKHFKKYGINVDLYEIGNEIDYGYAGVFDDTHGTDADWYKQNIWPYEAEAMKAAIRGIRKSNPTASIETHLMTWWDRDWVYNFTKFMLDSGVELNYTALSYYPTSFNENWRWMQDVYQNVGYLLSNIDYARQELLDDGYNIKFIIAEYSYSSGELWGWLKENFNNPIKGFSWSNYDADTTAYIKSICPKCQNTPSYPFTPQGQANWLNDSFDAVYTDNNITGTFYLVPEAATFGWDNFASVFYNGEPTGGFNYDTYEVCNDFTGTYEDTCVGDTLYEYDCHTSNICYYDKEDCAAGCSNGACSPTTTTTTSSTTTTTTISPCTCTNWEATFTCCSSMEKYIRTCTPAGCQDESKCEGPCFV